MDRLEALKVSIIEGARLKWSERFDKAIDTIDPGDSRGEAKASAFKKIEARWSERFDDALGDADPASGLGAANYDLIIGSITSTFGNTGFTNFFDPDLSLQGGSGDATIYALADFDNDKNLDIAAITNNPGPGSGLTIQVAPSQEDLQQGNSETAFVSFTADHTSAIAGRFDGDDFVDILLTGAEVNAAFMRNTYSHENGFGFELVETDLQLGTAPMLYGGDLDLDGTLDIVSLSQDDAVQVLLNDGGETLSFSVTNLPRHPFAIALGDFDNSGTLDIVLGGSSEPMQIAYNQGVNADGSLDLNFVEINSTNPAKSAQHFEIADYDGNGLQDILMIGQSKSFLLFLQQEDGSMKLVEEIPTAGNAILAGRQMAAADLDADGDIDFFQWWVANIYYYENTGLDSDGVPEFVVSKAIEIPNYIGPTTEGLLQMHLGGYFDGTAVTDWSLPYLGEGLPYNEVFNFMG